MPRPTLAVWKFASCDGCQLTLLDCEDELLAIAEALDIAHFIQALRNFADVEAFTRAVYAHPEYIETLATSTAIADHVTVDFELRGCPVSKYQLLELITATLAGRRPNIPRESQCMECKRNGTVCVMVANGTPCLGPVTQAGCGNLCPAVGRGCYGCFGPKENPNAPALSAQLAKLGMQPAQLRDFYRSFNAGAPAFCKESLSHD